MVYDPRIRAGIFAGESGGDYDALFGFQNRPGGKYANIKVSQMPIKDVIAFSMPQGEYGQSVKRQIGRIATPMGAYQVVGKTLRGQVKKLGLTGNEIFDQKMQDRIGQSILEEQGTHAWEGYRGPRDPKSAISKGPATVKPFSGQASISKTPVTTGRPALSKVGQASIEPTLAPPVVVEKPKSSAGRLSDALQQSYDDAEKAQNEAAWEWVRQAMMPQVRATEYNVWRQ